MSTNDYSVIRRDEGHAAYPAFLRQMECRTYGAEALVDAWVWFKIGWEANVPQPGAPGTREEGCRMCGDKGHGAISEAMNVLGNALYPGHDGDAPKGTPNTLWAFAHEAARRLASPPPPAATTPDMALVLDAPWWEAIKRALRMGRALSYAETEAVIQQVEAHFPAPAGDAETLRQVALGGACQATEAIGTLLNEWANGLRVEIVDGKPVVFAGPRP